MIRFLVLNSSTTIAVLSDLLLSSLIEEEDLEFREWDRLEEGVESAGMAEVDARRVIRGVLSRMDRCAEIW